jgi:hypothetical protein
MPLLPRFQIIHLLRVEGRWWGPYLGVALAGLLSALLVVGWILLNLPEIVRNLRTTGL